MVWWSTGWPPPTRAPSHCAALPLNRCGRSPSLTVTTEQASTAKQARAALGIRLREIRRDAGLTGRALATALGCHFTKVSRIEHGGQTPTEPYLKALCRVCQAEGQLPDLIASVRAIESMYLEWRRQTRAGMKR